MEETYFSQQLPEPHHHPQHSPRGFLSRGHTEHDVRPHRRKKLILCFDGTGNKFKGNSGDTNILKIFRMLDRTGGDQFHYYQPGIGTYITNGTLSRVHVGSRMKSWMNKAMDAAVGTSFDQHVIGGYKFLMRFYSPGDDIYMFGFSRGAYTARFLAEMLDHVGLVSSGNEEMVLFAWKTFSNWQQRQDNKRKADMYNYMRAFRETFARPVRRVRFLGLFDTVNSVPRFESAWLKRSGDFPYTAKSTARVIRHAVGIDERRAKFRQDLVTKIDVSELARRRSWKIQKKKRKAEKKMLGLLGSPKPAEGSRTHSASQTNLSTSDQRYNMSQAPSQLTDAHSMASYNMWNDTEWDSEDEDDRNQDIEEVWFPGAHGDIGGGWDLPADEEPLSHGPLVWMVREARKAGVVFDKQRMKEMNCWIDGFEDDSSVSGSDSPIDTEGLPQIEVTCDSPTVSNGGTKPADPNPLAPESLQPAHHRPPPQNAPSKVLRDAREYLERSYTHGKIHDCLCFNNGIGHVGVLGWKIMEYLPFRRMDLQPDGSWKAIIWPLPCGEVRDIPDTVKVHCSVLKRMKVDPKYRPGNLLVGGGGRGVRIAPEDVGMGEWVVVKDRGDPIGELFMKKSAYEDMRRRKRDSGHVFEDQDEKETDKS